MVENIDLSQKLSKKDFKKAKDELEITLATLQREARELHVPVIVVFEGWDAAGKGTLINDLILPLDPRGFRVYSMASQSADEALRPFLWRFWKQTPVNGQIVVFDRSWYWHLLNMQVVQKAKKNDLHNALSDILSFERLLCDDGAIIIKFFLHISKKEQNRRFKNLCKTAATAWRVTKEDRERHKRYNDYFLAIDTMLAQTDTGGSPWTIVEAHDRRFAAIKIFTTVVNTLQGKISFVKNSLAQKSDLRIKNRVDRKSSRFDTSVLDSVDLSVSLKEKLYHEELDEKQNRMRELEHEIYIKRIPVVIAFEGWDAAGKGGAIKRLTQKLDPRGYEVIPIAAPNDIEKSHHYLWRFWQQMPKAGHITIFDRTWYGRVLVERVEQFCSLETWKRAYDEINLMEKHLTNFGAVVLKFWLQLDKDEQLRRFKERESIDYKTWKITEEDWRNREKWDLYKSAVDEMIFRTGTPDTPWTVVEANCKWYARIKILDTTINAIENALKKRIDVH